MVINRNAKGDLFKAAGVPLPRTKNAKRMHVMDAGNGHGDTTYLSLMCDHCGHEEDGFYTGTVTEHKRGLLCPKCN